MPDPDSLQERLRSHVARLAGEIGERHFARRDALDLAVETIRASLQGSGYEPELDSFTVTEPRLLTLFRTNAAQKQMVKNASFQNILATLPGKTKEMIVVGAHYDTVIGTPGADDNASGVAVLLETARLLRPETFEKTVRFVAFANEEPPFFRTADMGSARYVRSAQERHDRISGMICLEMLGFYTEAARTQTYPPFLGFWYPDRGNFIAITGNLSSRPLVLRVASAFRKYARIPVEQLSAPGFVPGLDFSDQLNFWRARIPAVMITDTAFYRNPHYHRATDVPNTLRYDLMAEVAKGVCAAVRDLAGLKNPPERPGE